MCSLRSRDAWLRQPPLPAALGGARKMEQLSSSWTYFYKVIFTRVWIGGFGIGTIALFIAGALGDAEAAEMRSTFLLGLIFGSAFLYWGLMRLKKVHLKDARLIVSNFKHEIAVDLTNVDRVSGSILMSPELVWVHLRTPSKFGDKVIFMPKGRWSFGFSVHPVVSRLRQEVQRAHGIAA